MPAGSTRSWASASRSSSPPARSEAKAESIAAPASRTPSRGPKQPRQGIPASTQPGWQPWRVPGPMQTSPCARKQRSGSIGLVARRRSDEISMDSGFDSVRGQVSQSDAFGARTAPRGGGSPREEGVDRGGDERRRRRAARQDVVDLHHVAERQGPREEDGERQVVAAGVHRLPGERPPGVRDRGRAAVGGVEDVAAARGGSRGRPRPRGGRRRRRRRGSAPCAGGAAPTRPAR